MSDAFQNQPTTTGFRQKISALNLQRFPIPLISLIVIIWFVCFFELGRVDLLDLVDEGTYSSVARQMLESGDWITPRVGTMQFFDKPPLMYWLQAISMSVFGFTNFAARLPAAIAASFVALLLFYWGKRAGIPRAGWLAAVFYLLCPFVALGLARLTMMDSLLTLWLTLAVIGWIEGWRGHRKGYLLMALAVSLAVMTKGAIGFLFPGSAFVIWILLRRDWQEFRKFPWLIAACIFVVIVLPWHLAAWYANGDFFFQEYIIRQHVQRFLGKDVQNNMQLHNLPFWYYLPVTIAGMFPLSVFLPAAWWRAVRSWSSEKLSVDASMAMWVLWSIVVLGFFSAGSSKLPSYALPALPALVMVTAWRLNLLWEKSEKLSSIESGILCVISGGLGIVLFVIGVLGWGWRSQLDNPPPAAKTVGKILNWKESQSFDVLRQQLLPITELAPYWVFLGAALLVCFVVFILVWRNAAKTVYATIAMSLVIIFVGVHAELPLWAGYWTPLKELSFQTLPALERNEPLVIYSIRYPQATSLRYYLGRSEQITETFEPNVLQNILTGSGRGYIIAVKDTPLPALPGNLRQESFAGKWVLWRYDR